MTKAAPFLSQRDDARSLCGKTRGTPWARLGQRSSLASSRVGENAIPFAKFCHYSGASPHHLPQFALP